MSRGGEERGGLYTETYIESVNISLTENAKISLIYLTIFFELKSASKDNV